MLRVRVEPMIIFVRISVASSFVVSRGGPCSLGPASVLSVFEVAALIAVGAIIAML